MSLGLRLEVRQSQQLVMTPQLQQAIKLLQMSNLELCDFVETELERNPLLERAEPLGESAADPAATGPLAADHALKAGDIALAIETFDTGLDTLQDPSPGDGPLPGAEATGHWSGISGGGSEGTDGLGDLEERLAERPSLRAHLIEQLGRARAGTEERLIALALVEELDEHGLIRADLAQVAARLGVAQAAVEQGLALLQRCEPTGVGARDLAECLGLQLAERDRLDPAMARLLQNLELLARGELKRLRALCGVDEDDFADMLGELRTLDPRPCACFAEERIETLVPDLFLTPGRSGGWHIELNSQTLPKVLITNRYAAAVGTGDDAARAYLAECRANASWLVKSLDQRARTILKVATEIVRQQEGFFATGVRGLRPLTLRMVADAIGMHESTASRVTANKYIATPRGIFELKFFFTNAVGGEGADGVAAEAVRHRVRALIEAEAPDAVLSDDEIVERLSAEGIEIARRTVAKYRKSLGIASSVDRRRRHALHALG